MGPRPAGGAGSPALLLEEEIAAEVAQVARELQVDITLGHEGRRLNL